MKSLLKWTIALAAALGLTFSLAVLAQPSKAPAKERVEIAGIGVVEAVRVTASVEAVDLKNRIVTLKGPRGNVFAVPVSEQAKNLPQVKVGDIVELDYFESIAIDVKRGDGLPSRTDTEVLARAKPGERPGGVALRKVTTVASVLGINAESGTFLVRGPLGHLVEVKARDPKMLQGLRGGAQVEVTYVEGVAIAVRPGAPR
jgi:hypothetical protein